MLSMRLSGATLSEIATRYKISVARAHQILTKLEKAETGWKSALLRQELRGILSHHYPGCSRRHLARITGVKYDRLLYLIKFAPQLDVELPWGNKS